MIKINQAFSLYTVLLVSVFFVSNSFADDSDSIDTDNLLLKRNFDLNANWNTVKQHIDSNLLVNSNDDDDDHYNWSNRPNQHFKSNFF